MKILVLAAGLMALTVPMASDAMASDDWSVTDLSPGWTLQEQGDPGTPAEYMVMGVYEGDGFSFSFGCLRGYALDVVWKPSAPIKGGILVPATITIDDVTLVDGNIVPNDRNEYAWTGRDGDAYNIVAGIWEFWEGDITLSAAGVSDTVYINEDDLGGISELVLESCGK